ncbi:hypothetical protein TNCV_3973531 [Trichonephila clavipes]|nr:hypothetical protein TNCV_3973531 [Trichonephila clavipes]
MNVEHGNSNPKSQLLIREMKHRVAVKRLKFQETHPTNVNSRIETITSRPMHELSTDDGQTSGAAFKTQ